MLGFNEIASPRVADQGFNVHSVFFTIQGEGPFVGKPAIFLRLAGCNLRCFWCDTSFEEGHIYYAGDLITMLRAKTEQHNCEFIVITGGEPMLQPLGLLFNAAALDHCQFQIETAGTVWPQEGFGAINRASNTVSIVCSPKTPQVVKELHTANPNVYWKYIVRTQDAVDLVDGLPLMSTQLPNRTARLYRPTNLATNKDRIYVQGCDEGENYQTKANVKLATAIAMEHGYRLSLQTHKILGLE